MKRKGTRILCLIIAFAFAFTLMSGCGNQNTGSQDESSQAESSQVESSSTQTASNPNDLSAMKPIEFTYFIPDSSMKIPPEDAPILQQVYEKTKVKINFVIPPADAQEKLNIMLAAADYPDIIEFPNFVTMDKYIKAGYLVSLDDLLNKYGSDLKTNLGKISNRLKSEEDGKIYYLPSRYRVDGVEMFPETSLTFSIRSGYLEKKGWYKPQTLGDIENLLKEIKAQDPNTIPLSFALGGGEVRNLLMALLKIGLGANGLTYNESGELILQDDDTLGYSYKNENVRNFFMWLNKLYTEGLLDKESPVLTSDALNTKCSAGKVASVIGDYWGAPNEANKYFESKNDNSQFYYFYPKANENVKKVTYAPYSLAYSFGNAITDKCKDPVRAMQFINYLNTEDGFNAMHGVTNFDGEDKEGYDFYVDKNQGNAIFPTKWFSEQLTKDENFGASRGFMSLLGLGFSMSNLPGGKYDYIKVEEDVGAWDSEAIKRIKQGFGVKGTDYFPMMRDMSIDVTNITGLPLQTQSDEGIIKGKIDDYISKAVPKLIVSKTEADFTKGYNDMLSHLDEIGLEKYLTKMNDLYKQRKDLWK